MATTQITTYESDTKSNIEALTPTAGSMAICSDTKELGFYTDNGWVFIPQSYNSEASTVEGVTDCPTPVMNLDMSSATFTNDSGSPAADGDKLSVVTDTYGNQLLQPTASSQPRYVASTTSITTDLNVYEDAAGPGLRQGKPGILIDEYEWMDVRLRKNNHSKEHTLLVIHSLPFDWRNRRLGSTGPTWIPGAPNNHGLYTRVAQLRAAGDTNIDGITNPDLRYYQYNGYVNYFASGDTGVNLYLETSGNNATGLSNINDKKMIDPISWEKQWLNATHMWLDRRGGLKSGDEVSVIEHEDQQEHQLLKTSVSLTNMPLNYALTRQGQRVSHNAAQYECIKEHTSSSATEPGTGGGAEYWRVRTNESGDTAINIAVPAWSAASITYIANQALHFKMKLYDNTNLDVDALDIDFSVDSNTVFNVESATSNDVTFNTARTIKGISTKGQHVLQYVPHHVVRIGETDNRGLTMVHQILYWDRAVPNDKLNQIIDALHTKWDIQWHVPGDDVFSQYSKIKISTV